MRVFLDFEASSLGKRSYPIEVAWVFEDGRSESHLIRPAPDWDDWDEEAQAIHGIARETLLRDGEPHDMVAARMIDQLSGQDLRASAPSWDGKWLSALLRAAGMPRHSLRLGSTGEARAAIAKAILEPVVPPEQIEATVADLIVHLDIAARTPPAHRALADARAEHARWQAVQHAADAIAARGLRNRITADLGSNLASEGQR